MDLNGDGVPDYALDQGAYFCDGAASLFSGSGGSQLVVWASNGPGALVTKVFDGGHFGIKVDAEHKARARLLLALRGAQCGQKIAPQTANSDLQFCWRPLNWDPKRKLLQLAPLSEILAYEQ